ncbi:MAG: 5-(carboxyamino)imidazole ribonucleotide mutase [bacterium]|nr:5-(carboxyamino)imidazole ribonucleotide mutase [bacterium]
MSKPLVSIFMGSDSDLDQMKHCMNMLEFFRIPYEINIASAHRSPELVRKQAGGLEKKGVRVIIAGAGGAAHLAGVLAASTILPVIGVPMKTDTLSGLDSLYSIVQMPKGVPVAATAIGPSGAANAGVLAAQILALTNPGIKKNLLRYKKHLAAEIGRKAVRLKKVGYKEYLKQKEN